ncbi:MAG: ABC transporter ATP-binding protein [Anaerolineae bacterium]
MNHHALEIDNVTKVFGKSGIRRLLPRRKPETAKEPTLAVDHVSMSIGRGEIVGILGPNGSGKSTLVRLVSTLLLPDSGHVSVFGHDVVRDSMAVRRLINRVSVDAAFFKKLSPMENLTYAARLYGMGGGEARQRIVEILDRLGIEKKRVRSPLDEMSRGNQQKVAIARAFLTSPVLLLLDEPTTGLDPRSKRDVQEFVQKVRREHDTTVLLTTHDMAEAEELCDRIAVIHGGRIAALDTPQALKQGVPDKNGNATLEDAFFALTGKALTTEDEGEGDDST